MILGRKTAFPNCYMKDDPQVWASSFPYLLTLSRAGFRGGQDPHQTGSPHLVQIFSCHMYDMCTPPSHFYSEESLFVDVIKLSVVQTAVFNLYII